MQSIQQSATAMRLNHVLVVGSLGFFIVLLATKGVSEARLPLSSLPFLRGGYVTLAPRTRPREKRRPLRDGWSKIQHETAKRLSDLHEIGHGIGREWDKLGPLRDGWGKIQHETAKRWSDLHEIGHGIGREWDQLASSVAKHFSRDERGSTKKLDDVLSEFKSVLSGSEVDTAQLLKACRAHLVLMKSGGSAMRVVAKDMESNLNKAEALFKKLPREGKYLSSLLATEREKGVHDGNLLKNDSAAMGLLWIRRSLAFQRDLYAAVAPVHGRHPPIAALDAYERTLAPFHGWFLQKAFPLSLSQMPSRGTLIAKFGGRDSDLDEKTEMDIVKKLNTLVAVWEPIIDRWTYEFERLDLEDTRRV